MRNEPILPSVAPFRLGGIIERLKRCNGAAGMVI